MPGCDACPQAFRVPITASQPSIRRCSCVSQGAGECRRSCACRAASVGSNGRCRPLLRLCVGPRRDAAPVTAKLCPSRNKSEPAPQQAGPVGRLDREPMIAFRELTAVFYLLPATGDVGDSAKRSHATAMSSRRNSRAQWCATLNGKKGTLKR